MKAHMILFASAMLLLVCLPAVAQQPGIFWSRDTRDASFGQTAAGDIDGDGGLDAFIVGGHTEYPDYSGNFGRAYAISIGRGAGPEWRMFQRDIRRRASLCVDDVTGVDVHADRRAIPLTMYPIPVSDVLSIESPSLREIRIVDPLGRIVHAQPAESPDAGTLHIDIRGLPPGYYYLVAFMDGFVQVRPFVRR